MTQDIQKVEAWILKAVISVSIGIMVVLCIVTFMQVVMRYVFQNPPYWSEELARFLMVWVSFLGFNVVLLRRSEMTVTFFAERFPLASQRLRETVVTVLIIAFLGLAVYHGTIFAVESSRVRSVALQVPLTFVYVSLPLSFLLAGFLYVLRLIALWSTGEMPGPIRPKESDR